MSLTPDSTEALADIVRDAAASGDALAIRGGGSRSGFGHPVEGTALALQGLSGITLYEPGALTLVARAGTPLAEIEAALAEESQLLPFEPLQLAHLYGPPGSPGSPRPHGHGAASTIGGVVATNASGPRRIQSGACRDSLIGVEFVDGRGRIVKNGGRVMKNVTGYDLVKLMCGTHGTLGVLTDLSFKLLPAPEHAATLTLPDLPIGRAIAAMSAALGSPFNVSGAAHVPGGSGQHPGTHLRIEGLLRSVDYRAGELVRLLGKFGSAVVDDDPASVASTWRTLRDVRAFDAGNSVRSDGGNDEARCVWRISVKPTDGVQVAHRLEGSELRFDWGGGLVWARTSDRLDVRTALAGIGGHATLLRAPAEALERFGAFEPEPGVLAALSSGLRERFDPSGILNRGRLGSAAGRPVDDRVAAAIG